MIGNEFKIIFKGDKGYLTKEKALSVSQLGISNHGKHFKPLAYWNIRVLKHIEAERKLFCQILSYNVGVTEFSSIQMKYENVLRNIDKVSFKTIDTPGLLSCLETGTHFRINAFIEENKFDIQNATQAALQTNTTPEIITIKEMFSIPFKNIHFVKGGVTFEKKFKSYNKLVQVTIANEEILEEYDAIKNYFQKALDTKSIQVTINIEIHDGEIIFLNATSPEVLKINATLIESIKHEYIRTIKKTNIALIEKELLTKEEFLITYGKENFDSNILFATENDLFEKILSVSNSKHYKHLRFLSSKHRHELVKLRFIHKPFSFIFLLEGVNYYYFIWETLDTEEATYLWPFKKNIQLLKSALNEIEEALKEIKLHGKSEYITLNKDNLIRIYHDYSKEIEGFLKWKEELLIHMNNTF